MVAIKTLALPSLTKSASSRSQTPVGITTSEQGSKRNGTGGVTSHGSLQVRSRSGEGNNRRLSTGAPATSAVQSMTVLSPAPSASGTLRPKLASLLSGRNTPSTAPATPVLSHPPAGVAPTPTSTPASGPAGGSVAISTLEASYVTKVSMTLNDAVNKVFPSPSNLTSTVVGYGSATDGAVIQYKTLCAPRVDRAREIGQLIVAELHAAVNDQYLLRSLLRSAVLKSLSILLSRLESLVVTPAVDPAVATVARSVKEAENPPLVQRYTYMILRSAWELKKGLIKACSMPPSDKKDVQMPKFVKDTLAPWITKVDLLANKVWLPILNAIRDETVRLVVTQGQEAAIQSAALPVHQAIPGPAGRSMSLARGQAHHASSQLVNSSAVSGTAVVVPSQIAVPYLRDLASVLAAANRTFAWLAVCDLDVQKWKTSVGSVVVWKMLLTSSLKRVDSGAAMTRRQSPPLENGPRRSASSMGIGRLRGSTRRSPSPPSGWETSQATALVAELEAFENVVQAFVSSFSPPLPGSPATPNDPNEVACPKGKDCVICRGRYIPLDMDDSDDEEALPREAMQEAMTALSSFIVLLRFFAVVSDPVTMLLKAITAVDDLALAPEICPNLIRALDTLPPLILLHTLVARIPEYYAFRMPHELWSTSWRDYEKTMKGFHTGEEWTGEVGWELLKETRRVHRRLHDGQIDGSSMEDDKWLDLLRLAVTDLAEVEDLDDDSNLSSISVRN